VDKGDREGDLQMRMTALFGAKTSDFLKFVVCVRMDKGEGEPMNADIFRTREEGVNFVCDFIQMSFMEQNYV